MPPRKQHRAEQTTTPNKQPKSEKKPAPNKLPKAEQKTTPNQQPKVEQKTTPNKQPKVEQKTIPEVFDGEIGPKWKSARTPQNQIMAFKTPDGIEYARGPDDQYHHVPDITVALKRKLNEKEAEDVCPICRIQSPCLLF